MRTVVRGKLARYTVMWTHTPTIPASFASLSYFLISQLDLFPCWDALCHPRPSLALQFGWSGSRPRLPVPPATGATPTCLVLWNHNQPSQTLPGRAGPRNSVTSAPAIPPRTAKRGGKLSSSWAASSNESRGTCPVSLHDVTSRRLESTAVTPKT